MSSKKKKQTILAIPTDKAAALLKYLDTKPHGEVRHHVAAIENGMTFHLTADDGEETTMVEDDITSDQKKDYPEPPG